MSLFLDSPVEFSYKNETRKKKTRLFLKIIRAAIATALIEHSNYKL